MLLLIAALLWGSYVLVKLGGPMLFGRRQAGEGFNAKAIIPSGLAILALFLVDQAIHGRF
ncbi:MAG: hypothetical protein KY393_05710 [Actinobacteria bacterium]|nr:hypothetical protein [Actinomycetota bacterium]